MTPAAADDLAAFLRGFHSHALAAYMQVAAETGQWPPDSELTRRRANDLYEAEMRTRSAATEAAERIAKQGSGTRR